MWLSRFWTDALTLPVPGRAPLLSHSEARRGFQRLPLSAAKVVSMATNAPVVVSISVGNSSTTTRRILFKGILRCDGFSILR